MNGHKSLNKSFLRIKEVQQPYGVLFLVAGVLGISHNPFSEKSLDGVSDIKISKFELNPSYYSMSVIFDTFVVQYFICRYY